MRLLEELKALLWQAFHEGGMWSLDAMEKKGEESPHAAFNAWLKSEYPIMGVIHTPEDSDDGS